MKKIVLLAFVSVLLLSVVFTARFITLVTANPIPVPSLRMEWEYIDATISQINGVPWAAVDGEYPFSTLGIVNKVTMYYPVPPDSPAEKISVKMDDTNLSWSYCEPPKIYPTVVGDFPMIDWDISPVPGHFTIKTHYEHPLPLINGNYSFLYATGTGRYLGDPYAKTTIAEVEIYVSYDVAPEKNYINVYTIANVSGNWIWKPADYDITPEVGKWKITLTLVSEYIHPLVEDTLVTITPTFHDQVVVGDQTFDIYTTTNSTMSNFNFSQSLQQISFNVTGPEDTIGFCNITIPKTLLESLWDNNYTVLVDGSPPLTLNETSNGTHTFLYFTYLHSEHEVTIIPEFPTWTSMLLILIVLTFAIAISKRRLLKKSTH